MSCSPAFLDNSVKFSLKQEDKKMIFKVKVSWGGDLDIIKSLDNQFVYISLETMQSDMFRETAG